LKKIFLRDFPLANNKLLTLFILISVLAGTVVNYWSGVHLDDWVHDSALVHQSRKQWQYTGVVVLDDDVPIRVGRKQALPLFVKATEHLIAAGAKAVFLDSRVAKEMEGRMPYAVCIEPDGQAQWSMPECTVDATNQCQVNNSSVGNAPLKMSEQAITHFIIAPYLSGQESLPDFLLYDLNAAAAIPEKGLVGSDRLVTKDSPIARYLDLSRDHAIVKLAESMNFDLTENALQTMDGDEVCTGDRRCRRIRLGLPIYEIRMQGDRLILPVSRLASCDTEIANQTAALLKNKVVILQLTTPTEATDIIVTPMTTALFGPHAVTPGAQFLADAVETILNGDHPRKPNSIVTALLFLLVAVAGVLVSAFLKQRYVWMGAVWVFIVAVGLCFLSPLVQLWPVTAIMMTYLIGIGQVIATFLIVGYREGVLISHYMPRQIHNLLISLKGDESFQNRRCFALVLMSDLAGYTTVTAILKEPGNVLNLMNDYLGETSLVLQDKYNGWLENYVGDMVCYYWPYKEQERTRAYKNALCGAIELSLLQKQFFLSLEQRYKHKIDAAALAQVSSTINAGIGLAAGIVVMGDLGPEHGVKKFGILGEPLIMSARLESLTRFFNTEIILSGDLVNTAEELGFSVRRLAKVIVKGRTKAENLYALGHADDPRFAEFEVRCWENWIKAVEQKIAVKQDCPKIYNQDKKTIELWLAKNLLRENGEWHLDEK
jgi:adenylate cyclase